MGWGITQELIYKMMTIFVPHASTWTYTKIEACCTKKAALLNFGRVGKAMKLANDTAV